MFYHQNESPCYNSIIEKINIEDYSIVVSHAELRDWSFTAFPHKHIDDYVILYCLEGEIQIRVENAVLTLHERQMFFLRPGVVHNVIYSPEHRNQLRKYLVFIFSIQKNGKGEGGLMGQALQYFDKHPYKIAEDHFNAKAAILQMLGEFRGQEAAKRSAIRALYAEFIIFSFRCLISGKSKETQPPMSEKNIALEIVKYMQANYNKNITIADIAKEFSISKRHINRLFENLYGVSFKRTLSFCRLNYAKNYLLDTDYSVERIAELVGLSSPRVLSLLFYKEERMSVREWRRQNKSK